jgi:hypothetical protein
MFKDSNKLIQIVESHKWTLYQIPIGTRPSLEEIEMRGSAPYFDTGYDFLFAPIPSISQTLQQAYSLTNGLRPSLLIDPSWKGISEVFNSPYSIDEANVIRFTRIWFPNEKVAVVITPKNEVNPDPSCVAIFLPHLIETFEKYFSISKPPTYGLQISPMPSNPEFN